MNYLDDSIAQLGTFEGNIPHMYLDSVGCVTVGIGCMLPNAAAACQLPFHAPNDPQSAEEDAIAADFARVKAMPANRLPHFYDAPNALILMPSDISAICMSRLQVFDVNLRGLFPQWDSIPEPAKLAMLDMTYNMGFGGFEKFHKLIAAVNAGDWTTAASECLVSGSPAARQAWRIAEFQKAGAS